MHKNLEILPRKFYQRDTVKVAKELLGKTLVRKINGKILTGIITETEAYAGKNDPASHASRKKTERNKVMFNEVGFSYVYFTYGMYYCFNVVAKKKTEPAGAILIRSIQPMLGIKHMIRNRNTNKISNLTNGPGKLSQALKITLKQYNHDLTKNSSLYITDGIKPKKITKAPRIGISIGTEKLWNFNFTY
jgi:DNA-3-methyladenine glycosylase